MSAEAKKASRTWTLAQNTNTSRGSFLNSANSIESKNNFSLLGAAVLNSGLGVAYEPALSKNVSVGGFIANYSLKPELTANSFVSKTEMKFQTFGLVSHYFFNDSESSGWYGKGDLVSTKFQSAVDFSTGPDQSEEKSKFGVRFGGGYRVMSGEIASTKIVFDFGAEYGTGSRSELTAQKSGATNSIETTIASGLSLTINGGVLF